MHAYYIAAEFELREKPEWLDDFRKRYDDPFPYHVTLRGPAYFEKADLGKIQNVLVEIVGRTALFEVIFDTYNFSRTDNGHCVMVDARSNPLLHNLQRAIQTALRGAGEYVKPASVEYDANFHPHITIGRHLDDEQFKKAKAELKSSIVCCADVTDIALDIMDHETVTDLPRSMQKFVYALT